MRALGIVLAGGNSRKMGALSHKRAISAMPIAGSYRSIDFVLSNMSNSHIQKVAVITQYNSRSLHEHLSSSKWWDFGRKQGGLYTFTPTVTPENSNWYQGTADSIYQNLLFLKRSHEPYVVIATGDCVYKMDYNKVLEYHIAKKADVTVVVKEMPEDADVDRYGVVRMNDDGRIEEFEEKPMVARSKTVSCGIYVIRRRQLIELIEKSAEEGRHDLVQDILIRYKDVKRIYGYKIESYWRNIATVEDYSVPIWISSRKRSAIIFSNSIPMYIPRSMTCRQRSITRGLMSETVWYRAVVSSTAQWKIPSCLKRCSSATIVLLKTPSF